MLAAIGREFSRQLSEYKQFKVNLLFANLGIFFLITGFLTYFDSQQDTFELFILLFTWYFSSHSITHPTYFIEDEIADRTIINVIQSRRSIFGMLFVPLFFYLNLFQFLKSYRPSSPLLQIQEHWLDLLLKEVNM